MKPSPGGRAMPVFQAAPNSALRRSMIRESQRGTVAFVLKLDEQAQRLSGQMAQPTWLLLTEEEGGFAKRGFWLREHGRDRYVDQPYVALVVDADSIADGSFEEIFAHETGHVLLRRLLARFPAGMSRANHGSLTITDDPTAFDEGFAIHFQGLSRLLTLNRALQHLDRQELHPDSPLLPLLAQSWLTTDPPQGKRFVKLFVETTYGATIERALPQATMELAQIGRLGKQQAFVEHLQPARAQLAALIEQVNQQPVMLTAGLGPALWIAVTESLVLNLNTAEADQLVALDASLAEWGGKIVVERDAHGPYGSLGDLVQRAGMPESIAVKIRDMAATAIRLGSYPRL